MAEITKIVITKNPGYGCSSFMFQEKITLTANSIEYKLIPHMNNKRDTEKHWKYQSNSNAVKDKIKEAFDEIGKIVWLDEDVNCLDVGSIEFAITYSDKTRFKKAYWRPPTDFRDGLIAIRESIPHTEQIPIFFECL